jgi:hypothetical protein
VEPPITEATKLEPPIPESEIPNPTILDTAEGTEATFGGEGKGKIVFKVENGEVDASQVFQGSQKARSAGTMLVKALRGKGIHRPTVIKISQIEDPANLHKFANTLANAVRLLGGKIIGGEPITGGSGRFKSIEVHISYPGQ